MNKNDALKIIFSCADKYTTNLSGHTLLFVCSNKYKQLYTMEVLFNSSNFLHMTGLKANGINANNFLNRCLSRRLSVDDFEFSSDGTTPLKLQVLPILMSNNLKANMIGNLNESRPKLYTDKLAGSTRGCMGFVRTGNGNLVPNTVLNEDIRNSIDHPDRIIITYRKKFSDKDYTEIVYTAKKIKWENIVLPDPYANLPLPKQL